MLARGVYSQIPTKHVMNLVDGCKISKTLEYGGLDWGCCFSTAKSAKVSIKQFSQKEKKLTKGDLLCK